MLGQTWRKSIRSGDNGACVEVRRVGGTIEVRDTKDRSKTAHVYTLEEWEAFIGGAKAGEFDL
ncbi:DUF397 domain-containing protein [Actinoplanes sp. NPDC020271]|uniref:DUF397 domain-containing protein n=1 Tax=Actinoplanes sp. NPDC020271 TaxID=3363896 RepID=UPI00379FAE2A